MNASPTPSSLANSAGVSRSAFLDDLAVLAIADSGRLVPAALVDVFVHIVNPLRNGSRVHGSAQLRFQGCSLWLAMPSTSDRI